MELDEFFGAATTDDALATFEEALKTIASRHAAAPASRAPVMDAMELMVAFVSKRISEDCARPFAAIYRGFQDLDAGQASGVMQPAPRSGRPSDRVGRAEVKAMVAAVVDKLLERQRIALPDACGKVAGWLAKKGVGVPRRGHQIPATAGTIDGWRQTVSANSRLEHSRKLYGAALASAQTEADLQKALNRLIEVVYDR